MVDEPTKGNPAEDAFFFFGALAILIALWYFAGGPGQADLRGIFLAPLQPLSSGDAYGPQFGATTTPKVEEPATFQPDY